MRRNSTNLEEVDPEQLEVSRRYGLRLMTHSPLAVGLLSGRFCRSIAAPADMFWDQERVQAALTEPIDQWSAPMRSSATH